MSESLASRFLQISKVDLKASRILYENDLYAPAVFHMQQCVEKAIKSLLIFLGVAPKDTKELEEWLRKKTGHQVAKNLNKIMEIYWSRATGDLPFAKSLMKRFSSFIKEQSEEYSSAVKEIEGMDITKYEEVEKRIDWAIRILETKNWETSWINQKFYNECKKILSLMPNIVQTRILETLRRAMQPLVCTVTLLTLSLILEKFEQYSRYPSVKNPKVGPSLFKEDYPLMRKFNSLITDINKVLEKLECITARPTNQNS